MKWLGHSRKAHIQLLCFLFKFSSTFCSMANSLLIVDRSNQLLVFDRLPTYLLIIYLSFLQLDMVYSFKLLLRLLIVLFCTQLNYSNHDRIDKARRSTDIIPHRPQKR